MNIKNKLYVICGVLLGLLAAPLTATAADFTFNVPVNIQNQEAAINGGEVRCSIYVRQQFSDKDRIGEGVQFFSLDNLGSFQGTLTVAFYADPSDLRESARFYKCVLRLQEVGGNYTEQASDENMGRFSVSGSTGQTN
jgi:hypothetical protein